jgi:hypothetical protein
VGKKGREPRRRPAEKRQRQRREQSAHLRADDVATESISCARYLLEVRSAFTSSLAMAEKVTVL